MNTNFKARQGCHIYRKSELKDPKLRRNDIIGKCRTDGACEFLGRMFYKYAAPTAQQKTAGQSRCRIFRKAGDSKVLSLESGGKQAALQTLRAVREHHDHAPASWTAVASAPLSYQHDRPANPGPRIFKVTVSIFHECFCPHGSINANGKHVPGAKTAELSETMKESGLVCQLRSEVHAVLTDAVCQQPTCGFFLSVPVGGSTFRPGLALF
jgi:hypothetical protein